MKVSKELADILRAASEEVDTWPQWKRSLDPIGDRNANKPQNAGHGCVAQLAERRSAKL